MRVSDGLGLLVVFLQPNGNASAADGSDDRVDTAWSPAAGPADRVRSGRPTVGAGPCPAAGRSRHDTGLSDAPPVSGKTTPRATGTGHAGRVARLRSPPSPSPSPPSPAPQRLRGQRAFYTENGHLVISRRNRSLFLHHRRRRLRRRRRRRRPISRRLFFLLSHGIVLRVVKPQHNIIIIIITIIIIIVVHLFPLALCER